MPPTMEMTGLLLGLVIKKMRGCMPECKYCVELLLRLHRVDAMQPTAESLTAESSKDCRSAKHEKMSNGCVTAMHVQSALHQ